MKIKKVFLSGAFILSCLLCAAFEMAPTPTSVSTGEVEQSGVTEVAAADSPDDQPTKVPETGSSEIVASPTISQSETEQNVTAENPTPEASETALAENLTPEASETALEENLTPEASETALEENLTPSASETASVGNPTPEASETAAGPTDSPTEPENEEPAAALTDTPAVTETASPEPTNSPVNGGENAKPKSGPNKVLILAGAAVLVSAGGFLLAIALRRKPAAEESIEDLSGGNKVEKNFQPVAAPYSCGECIGQGKRNYQEDALWHTPQPEFGKAGLYVIADGMGGMDNGKESSNIVSRYFEEISASLSPAMDIPSQLRRCAEAANQQVYQNNSSKGMNGGTTLVCVYLIDNNLYWLSVGDSRIYLYRNGILAGINEEHEFENRLYDRLLAGNMPLDEIRDIQEGELRKLTSNLGRDWIPIIDQNYMPFRLRRGDRVLLCSDGVSGTLSENDMITCLSEATPQKSAEKIEKMVQAAKKPHQDNFSAIVIGCETEDGQ